jgi:hypothetical protein
LSGEMLKLETVARMSCLASQQASTIGCLCNVPQLDPRREACLECIVSAGRAVWRLQCGGGGGGDDRNVKMK